MESPTPDLNYDASSPHRIMLTSEGDDSVSLKRKKGNERKAEGSQNKNKKRDDYIRPACSWVHFSREFIKEYSASHPESSGLKAATKAASDAWKQMGPEEKEKYTNRAREVWDEYLSSAPPRSPKPRKQSKLVTRCSPGRLLHVLQQLSPEQRDSVKSMGFGSILGLRCRTLRRSLCLWLLERFNAVRCSLEICGEKVPLTPRDVELVMGLAASGEDVVNSGPDESILELRKKYEATNRGISVRLLEERLTSPDSGEDFKRSFVLYVLGTLLCPTARLDVSPSFLHFLTDMNVIHQFNWGKFLLDRLVREVSRFRQGKQRAVGGCLLFLQLFYYESVAVRAVYELAPVAFPCLFSWGEEEITEREKLEKEMGGYGNGECVCKERGLGMGPMGYRAQIDGDVLKTMGPNDEGMDDQVNEEILAVEGKTPIDVPTYSNQAPCGNTSYGCLVTMDCVNSKDHAEFCAYAPCICPIKTCDFIDSSIQLSHHFSSCHWDSGRRFQYNSPLRVSLGKKEPLLVLQAEEDGMLFLLSRETESIGYRVMITSIRPSTTTTHYSYDIVSEKGSSSLRLQSVAQNFPGRIEGFPPDFLLIPFTYMSSSGKLEFDVCIWSSTDANPMTDDIP
ncbi:unnamed protein product [Cuscuta epithymum]|uniref:RING-type E3 ubiquitin transferase n=2 Tax=Cuscuta epithymum TaxID=186058 RepID=A0AAV0DD92_9ASTE|nr:unnamed protein product [Cuscuta epithymum]CAH9141924.1 unnamed protein product [Cuscuta epithymum]